MTGTLKLSSQTDREQTLHSVGGGEKGRSEEEEREENRCGGGGEGKRTGGEEEETRGEKKSVEEVREETVTTCGMQVSSIATREGLTSDDPFLAIRIVERHQESITLTVTHAVLPLRKEGGGGPGRRKSKDISCQEMASN